MEHSENVLQLYVKDVEMQDMILITAEEYLHFTALRNLS